MAANRSFPETNFSERHQTCTLILQLLEPYNWALHEMALRHLTPGRGGGGRRQRVVPITKGLFKADAEVAAHGESATIRR